MKKIYIMCLFLLLCFSSCKQNSRNENPETSALQESSISDSIAEISETANIAYSDNPESAYKYDEKGFQNISFTAYVQDPDTKSPTNIREKPGGTVLVPLEQGQDYMVDIIGQRDGWFKINMVHCIDPNNAVDIPGQIGWIHHSVLAVSTANYGRQKINAYEYPDKSTAVVGVIQEETEVRFTKIYKNFVFIQFTNSKGTKVSGWVEDKWLCGNPVTNCC